MRLQQAIISLSELWLQIDRMTENNGKFYSTLWFFWFYIRNGITKVIFPKTYKMTGNLFMYFDWFGGKLLVLLWSDFFGLFFAQDRCKNWIGTPSFRRKFSGQWGSSGRMDSAVTWLPGIGFEGDFEWHQSRGTTLSMEKSWAISEQGEVVQAGQAWKNQESRKLQLNNMSEKRSQIVDTNSTKHVGTSRVKLSSYPNFAGKTNICFIS